MQRILEIMRGGVREGLAGTEYQDRILPRQSHEFAAMLESAIGPSVIGLDPLLTGDLWQRMHAQALRARSSGPSSW